MAVTVVTAATAEADAVTVIRTVVVAATAATGIRIDFVANAACTTTTPLVPPLSSAEEEKLLHQGKQYFQSFPFFLFSRF